MRFIVFALATWAVGFIVSLPAHAVSYTAFKIEIERLTSEVLFPGSGITAPEDELPTFSGQGTIVFKPVATDPFDIQSLFLSVTTLGTDASNAFGFGADTVHEFLYDETDITGVTALGFDGSGITGVLDFGGLPGKDSVSGDVVLQNLVLNFDTGRATGFCFSGDANPGTAECIRGGGTSTGIEAGLKSAVVPLPASLPLMFAGLVGLGVVVRFRKCQR